MSNPLWQPVGVKDGVEGSAGRSGRAAPGKEIRLMKFKRFTKPLWLRSVGRAALTQVFGRFAGELAQRGKALPPAHLDDDAWLSALGFLLLAPESLPDELNDTLFVIEEMATTEGLPERGQPVDAVLHANWAEALQGPSLVLLP